MGSRTPAVYAESGAPGMGKRRVRAAVVSAGRRMSSVVPAVAFLPAAAVASSALFQPAPAAAQANGPVVEAMAGGQRFRITLARHRTYGVVNAREVLGRLAEGAVSGDWLRARVAGRELVLEAESPFFRLGGETRQLANPPYRWGGAFWVPAELVTRLWPGGAGAPDAAPVDRLAAGISDRLDESRPWRVIIDPGHGGKDPGTSSRNATEKEIVLGIGKALRDELATDDGFVPVMTRDRDVFIHVLERSRIAVREEGDLFVSIHVNSAPSRGARGFETFFLGLERTEEAREVALRENSAMSIEEADAGLSEDLEFILTGMDRNENLAESRTFGGYVQNAFRGVWGGAGDRGVKQGRFWVLLGALARMPSVIVEVGFITNSDDARTLRSAEGQRSIARGIAEAIREYRRDLVRRYGDASR